MADGRSSFLVTDPLMQNDPNQSTKPMRDCSHGFPVPEARYQPAIHDLEYASFELDRTRKWVTSLLLVTRYSIDR
jgi:hypothetical protein